LGLISLITSDWDNKDNRIKIGSYEISKSHNEKGKSIFWDRKKSQCWIMFGWDGLTFFDKDPYRCGDRFKITGIDVMDLLYRS
jgi:hypothetical protein